jgi:hypothetical protein
MRPDWGKSGRLSHTVRQPVMPSTSTISLPVVKETPS